MRKAARSGRRLKNRVKAPVGAEPGGLLRSPMPSMSCALLTPLRVVLPFGQVHFVQSRISVGHGRRFTFWSAKKGTQKALFRCFPASRSQAKSLIKTGWLH